MGLLTSYGAQAADHTAPKLSGFKTISGHLAMEAFEQLGSDAVPDLIQALKYKDKHKRKWAARALGRLGSGAAPAGPDLLQTLNDQDPTVYAEAASALGRIGPAAVPSLLSALRSSDRSLRLNATWSLGHLGSDAAESISTLRELATVSDEQLSQMAAAALKKIQPT